MLLQYWGTLRGVRRHPVDVGKWTLDCAKVPGKILDTVEGTDEEKLPSQASIQEDV